MPGTVHFAADIYDSTATVHKTAVTGHILQLILFTNKPLQFT